MSGYFEVLYHARTVLIKNYSELENQETGLSFVVIRESLFQSEVLCHSLVVMTNSFSFQTRERTIGIWDVRNFQKCVASKGVDNSGGLVSLNFL